MEVAEEGEGGGAGGEGLLVGGAARTDENRNGEVEYEK